MDLICLGNRVGASTKHHLTQHWKAFGQSTNRNGAHSPLQRVLTRWTGNHIRTLSPVGSDFERQTPWALVGK